MFNYDEQDDIPAMNRKDTEHNLPLGWVIFFVALIVWGIYYIYSYTPGLSDWSQNSEYEIEYSQSKSIIP